MSTYRNLVFKKLRQIHRSAALQIKSYILCTIHAYSLSPLFYPDKQSDDLHSIVLLLTEELKPSIAKLPAIAEVQTNSPGTHFVCITGFFNTFYTTMTSRTIMNKSLQSESRNSETENTAKEETNISPLKRF